MSADTSDLTKVDSAVGGVEDVVNDKKPAGKARKSSSYPGVKNVSELQEEGTELQIAPETQKLGWKLNASPKSVDDPAVLKKSLTTPPVKKIDLVTSLGVVFTARNIKGVTIQDALDVIYKSYKKKADDELEDHYLKGFEWDKEESWAQLKIHLSKNSTAPPMGGGKKKNKKGTAEEE